MIYAIAGLLTACSIALFVALRSHLALARERDEIEKGPTLEISTKMMEAAETSLDDAFSRFNQQLDKNYKELNAIIEPETALLERMGFVRGTLFEFKYDHKTMNETDLSFSTIEKGTSALFMGFDDDGFMKMLIEGRVRKIPRSAHVYVDTIWVDPK